MPAHLPRILITVGEPAGIGPDIVCQLAQRAWPAQLAVLADPELLAQRARQLGLNLELGLLDAAALTPPHRAGHLSVLPVATRRNVEPGRLDPHNAAYVLETLDWAADLCASGAADAMVTAPVHKGVINDAGIPFSGHTEYLAERLSSPEHPVHPVMMLAAGTLRVALVTTHLPLRAVADAITPARLERVIRILDADLRQTFAIARPRILVCGLNPHAGEGGHLGREEIDLIEPLLSALSSEGLVLEGPLPADTLFTPRRLAGADAVLAMYHDQGLPVLKHAGFGQAVNITLGLPILRTSVDHGTALDLAGSGRADAGSLAAALELAIELSLRRRSARP